MKKIIILILTLFLVSGCTVKKIDDLSVDSLIDTIVKSDKKIYNRVAIGYKYYLPVGVLVESAHDYNEVLYTENANYYLFLDLVSYQNETDLIIEEDDDQDYYKSFSSENSKGYLAIEEGAELHYIKAVYNHAKIEAYVEKGSLKSNIYQILRILTSIDYNGPIIERQLSNKTGLNDEETTIEDFTPNKNSSNFLEYIERYDDYSKTDEIDDLDIDTIKPNNVE